MSRSCPDMHNQWVGFDLRFSGPVELREVDRQGGVGESRSFLTSDRLFGWMTRVLMLLSYYWFLLHLILGKNRIRIVSNPSIHLYRCLFESFLCSVTVRILRSSYFEKKINGLCCLYLSSFLIGDRPLIETRLKVFVASTIPQQNFTNWNIFDFFDVRIWSCWRKWKWMMRSSDLSIQIADRLGGFFLGGGGESVGGNGCGECVWDDRRWGRSLLLLRWPSWKKEMMSRFVSGSRSTSSVVRWRTITSANCPSRAPRFPWRRGENRVLDKIFRAEWNTAPDWLKEGRHITGSHRALNFKMLFLQPSEVVCLASSDRIV